MPTFPAPGAVLFVECDHTGGCKVNTNTDADTDPIWQRIDSTNLVFFLLTTKGVWRTVI